MNYYAGIDIGGKNLLRAVSQHRRGCVKGAHHGKYRFPVAFFHRFNGKFHAIILSFFVFIAYRPSAEKSRNNASHFLPFVLC